MMLMASFIFLLQLVLLEMNMKTHIFNAIANIAFLKIISLSTIVTCLADSYNTALERSNDFAWVIELV